MGSGTVDLAVPIVFLREGGVRGRNHVHQPWTRNPRRGSRREQVTEIATPAERTLYPVKVAAGWISVVLLCGMLGVAIDRGPNQAYIALVAAVTVAVVIGLVVLMRRHARRTRRSEQGSTR